MSTVEVSRADAPTNFGSNVFRRPRHCKGRQIISLWLAQLFYGQSPLCRLPRDVRDKPVTSPLAQIPLRRLPRLGKFRESRRNGIWALPVLGLHCSTTFSYRALLWLMLLRGWSRMKPTTTSRSGSTADTFEIQNIRHFVSVRSSERDAETRLQWKKRYN